MTQHVQKIRVVPGDPDGWDLYVDGLDRFYCPTTTQQHHLTYSQARQHAHGLGLFHNVPAVLLYNGEEVSLHDPTRDLLGRKWIQ